jgi:cell division protein FtsW (lipid II flippase)
MKDTEKSIIRSIYIIIIILCAILSLLGDTFDYGPIILGVSSCVLLSYGHFIIKKFYPEGDKYLFIIAAFISQFGLVMIYRLNSGLAIKQITWFTLGIGVFIILVIFLPELEKFEKYKYWYIVIAILLLSSTLFLGSEIKGSKNWLKIGSMNAQPSEFAKLFIILYLASAIKKIENKVDAIKVAIPAFIAIGLLVVEKDLGSAMIFFGIFITMLYIGTSNGYYLLAGLFSFMGGGVLSYFLFNHVRIRIAIWLDPFKYKNGSGNQICQSLFAISSGGLFGTGLGLGKPYYVPLAHNDFIFAAICEEFGILGALALILMYLVLVYRGLQVAIYAKDDYSRLIAVGITSMIAFQVFVIIGGVTKMIPLTGITLPFVSYGGTSMLLNFACLGVLQKISESGRLKYEK